MWTTLQESKSTHNIRLIRTMHQNNKIKNHALEPCIRSSGCNRSLGDEVCKWSGCNRSLEMNCANAAVVTTAPVLLTRMPDFLPARSRCIKSACSACVTISKKPSRGYSSPGSARYPRNCVCQGHVAIIPNIDDFLQCVLVVCFEAPAPPLPTPQR